MTIIVITIAYLLGIIWGLYCKNIALIFFAILILISTLYISIIINKKSNISFSKCKILIFLLFFIFGIVRIYYTDNLYDTKFNEIKEEIKIEAIVISNLEKTTYKSSYIIKVNNINGNNKFKNTRLKIYIKNNKKDISYGDRITCIGTFRYPEESRNYKGFNYRENLNNKKIYGIVDIEKIEEIEKNKYNLILILINKFSNKITQNIEKTIEGKEAGILSGILIGNKDNLEESIKENFRDSNLSHMLAVSGAHVSYLTIGLLFIFEKDGVGKKITKNLIIIFLIFFSILTGLTPSVTRACIMAIYILIGTLLYKKPNVYVSICFSMFIILMFNPYNIRDIGFQLSYGGTIGIIAFNDIISSLFDKLKNNKIINNYIENKMRKSMHMNNYILNLLRKILTSIKNTVIVSLSANIMIIPIIAYHYNTISLTFIISNILANSIFGIIVILGFFVTFISFFSITLAKLLGKILKFLIVILIKITEISSKLPLSKIYIKTPYVITILLYYLILILIFLYYNKKSRENRIVKKTKEKIEKFIRSKILAKFKIKNKNRNKNKLKSNNFTYKMIIVVILIIIITSIETIKININNELKINFIDVGQGDSTLIRTSNNKVILIDGGGNSDNSNYDIGENTLLPYLLDRRITKIDYLIISHFDSDHCGGLFTILKELKVKKVIIGIQFEKNTNLEIFNKIIKNKSIEVQTVKEGDKIAIDKNTYFEVLWPNSKDRVIENSINNNALVLKMNYIYNNKKSISLLFTGDIEKEAESILVEKYKNSKKLNSSILKAGHHGSKTSSTQEFLELVKPKITLIGVGKNNKFGHPNEEVIERLNAIKSKIFRTDEDGEISIIVNNNGKIEVEKQIKNNKLK